MFSAIGCEVGLREMVLYTCEKKLNLMGWITDIVFIEDPDMGGIPCQEGGDHAIWRAVVVCGTDEAFRIPFLDVDGPVLDADVGVQCEESAIFVDLAGDVPDHAHDTHAGMSFAAGDAVCSFCVVCSFTENDGGADEFCGSASGVGVVCKKLGLDTFVCVCATTKMTVSARVNKVV